MNNQDVVIWHIRLSNGDWYTVFAKHEKDALGLLVSVHYDNVDMLEFLETYKPTIRRVSDNEKMLVNCEDRGQRNWSAKRWAKGETLGMFTSNTYDW